MTYVATDKLFGHPVRVQGIDSTPHPGASKTYMVKLPAGTLPRAPKCYTADKVLVKMPREISDSTGRAKAHVAENERYAWAAAKALGWDVVPEVIEPRYVFPGTVPDGVVVTRWLRGAIAAWDSGQKENTYATEYARAQVFQVLINKGDTHGQNMVYASGRYWSIDHDLLDSEFIPPSVSAKYTTLLRAEMTALKRKALPVKVLAQLQILLRKK